jgi:hypothetical protein
MKFLFFLETGINTIQLALDDEMKKYLWCAAVAITVLCVSMNAYAQTVPVKFRYFPDASYSRINFPGTFNGWGPNTSGAIASGTVSQADSYELSTGMWVKTIPLAFGTYQYKIYQQRSAVASDWNWISDPLNRVTVTADNNSQMVVTVLFSFRFLPIRIRSKGDRSLW